MSAVETLTFVFTDIEGSTARWEAEPEAMREALALHDAVLAEAFSAGNLFKHTGDGVCVAFGSVVEAIESAVAAQRRLSAEEWPTTAPIRVRMGIHTGEAQRRDGDFYGTALNRAARVMDVGHGGQILLSAATRTLVSAPPAGVDLRNLGEHRLKDLGRAEHLHQVGAEGLVGDFPPLRSVEAYDNNLPSQLTAFIGRESELSEILEILAESRLVTLTGVGGVGKTRLAIQVAAESLDRFGDGVWFVELAPVSDASHVTSAVADALGVREEAGRPLLEVLLDHVRDRSLLIVLDNCEHLIDEAAKLAEVLLRAAPDLTMIATSREGLAIGGERLWRVPSLTRSGSTADAVALFVERARLVDPAFEVTDGNRAAIEDICTRLDGIPLAIELATARLKVFPPSQIAERLGDRFRLLTGGSRTALPRQRTLQATMDWSYELLTEHQRTLLRRLSVFYGGFEFESAEDVCGVDPLDSFEVLDLLTQLIESSLVSVDDRAESRYSLLETVRQYGLDRLVESGEADAVRRRHAEHFAALAATVDVGLLGPDAGALSARLERDDDNVRAALTWALEAAEHDLTLALAEGMGRSWFFSSSFREGAEWLDRALRAVPPSDTESYAELLSWAGMFALHRGLFREAEHHLDRSLEIARSLEDPVAVARAENGRGNMELARGNLTEALRFYERALENAADHYRGVVLVNTGFTLAWMGDAEGAARAADEIDRSFADNWAWALVVRATIEETSGTLESMERVHREAIERLDSAGERILEVWTMIGLCEVERRRGDLDAALEWMRRADELSREIGAGSNEWLGRIGVARVHLDQGDHDAVRADIEFLVDFARRAGGAPRLLSYAAEAAGRLAAHTGDMDEGIRLVVAADRMLADAGARRPGYLDEELAAVFDGVDEATAEILRAEGGALDGDELIARITAV